MAFLEIMAIIATALAFFTGIIEFVRNSRLEKQTNANVLKAEEMAFKDKPNEYESRLIELSESHANLEDRATEISELIEESRDVIKIGRLFNLYSKQIEKYHQQTRSRARWSFTFAIISMFSGLGLIIWAGSILLTADKSIALAAGGIISTIGGGVSGFIAKTFLDVHKLSLNQLKTYYRQPVINEHIVMAQKLAEDSGDPETRKKAYNSIVDSLIVLIEQGSIQPEELMQ
jgi:hypothetical protein